MTQLRVRAVVLYKAPKPVGWHDRPKPESFDRAERELGKLGVPDAAGLVDRLRRGKVEMVPAAELARRMSGG